MTNKLICPVCGCPLIFCGESMRCEKGHCFDIAKEGYINLLMKKYAGLYIGSDLFLSRRKVYDSGFFDPIIAECAYLIESMHEDIRFPSILDIGCGEGSFLRKINKLLPDSDCIGSDISKNAVRLASKACKSATWIVSDLCAMPIADGSVDCILNILAPANYSEFDRILKPGGSVIKVVPNRDYLKELREIYNIEPLQEKGTNDLFIKNFTDTETSSIKYVFDVDKSLQYDIMSMTPLLNHKNIALRDDFNQITIDVEILIGKK